MSLVIMNAFKGQENIVLKELCTTNLCEIVIVPHNLRFKFQPLDISVNKAAKSFISDKYNTWMANEVSNQLKRGISPCDVKFALQLGIIKPLHAKWIVELYTQMQNEQEKSLMLQICRNNRSNSKCWIGLGKNRKSFSRVPIVCSIVVKKTFVNCFRIILTKGFIFSVTFIRFLFLIYLTRVKLKKLSI